MSAQPEPRNHDIRPDEHPLDAAKRMVMATTETGEPTPRGTIRATTLPSGVVVEEMGDGTLFEVDGTQRRQVITHVSIYKSLDPDMDGQWVVTAEPGTGNTDDQLRFHFMGRPDLTWGLDFIKDAVHITTRGAVVFRDRTDQIYQLTPPKEGRH